MKRILAMLLVAAMMFGLLAGCGNGTPDPTTEPTTTAPTQEAQPDLQLEKAIEYLRAFYKNAAEKTPMDYSRLATVRIGTTTYEIVWSVDVPEEVLKIVKGEDNSFTIDINEEASKESTEAVPYVLTATITGKDGRQLSISWNHIIPAAIDEDVIETIKKAYALAAGEALEGTYTVTGVIKAIKTPYDPSYMNISVTIEVAGVEDMPIVCYRLKGDGADKLAVGDTITVTGSFMNYNGQIQFAAGCILEAVESGGGAAPVAPENPVDILKQAYALAPGESLPYNCSLSGVITFVDQAYSADYGNITVTMRTNGYTIKCYRIKGSGVDQLNVNDEITVSGVITNYNGTIEFAAGSMLVSRVDHEPPAKQPDPTPGTTLTVAQAYTVGMGKDHDTYTEGSYYVTGKIVSIENTTFGNMHISDGTGTLMIYGTWSEDGNTRYDKLVPVPAVGDTITLYGKIGRFSSNPQMKNARIIGAKGETPEIPDAPSVDVVTELVAGTPYRFGMTQGNLEDAVYYLAGGMDGYYMATTADPDAAINVYVEQAEGGYYFYTFDGETKLYINMVVSADGAHVNGAYEATASTVYTYNATNNTLLATVGGAEYWFGTRNDKTYTTMGPCKVEYEGFFGQFYVGSADAPTPDEPEVPQEGELVADKAYKFGMTQGNLDNAVYYLAGGMDGYYMATTEDVTAAIDVYVEETEGGYYFYTLDGETKLYINMVVSGTHVNGAYEPTASTVYTYDSEKNTLLATVDGVPYWFGTRNDKTYTTMGPCKVEYEGFYGKFYDLNPEPDEPEAPQEGELVADKAYNFGMTQGNLDNAVYYLAGGMDGYYMATTTDPNAAIDVYVEATEGGYNFYTLDGETKLYINMVVSGTHVNGAYEPTASTVYTYDSEKNTLLATVDGVPYWFGTRNDKTYTTMGPCKVEYAGFFGQFYAASEEAPEEPDVPEEPEEPAAGLQEGVAYTISAANGTGTLWFNGTVTSGRFNGSYDKADAVSVYAENVADGFLLYFMEGETKQYICIADTSSGGSFSTDATAATIFEWNADKETAAVADDSNNRGFGCGATSTYTNFSAYDLSGNYNWGQFIPVDGGNTEPDVPVCEHTNTTVEGAKEATCTTDGHTGKTVCADCGETISEGEVIAATGHSFVDGTCGVCGEADPNYTPDVPAIDLEIGKAYKFGLTQVNLGKELYFAGTMSGNYFATTEDATAAPDVFIEEAEGGYRFYFMDGEVKTYIDIQEYQAGKSGVRLTAEPSATFVWNAELGVFTAYVAGADRYLGTYSTYNTISNSDIKYISGNNAANIGVTQFVAKFLDIVAEPEACQHTNTTVEGAKEATCTTDGHTGKTVCADCGEVISEGEVIAATGHSYVDGTCTGCGEADPNYTPDVPAIDLEIGKAYKFGLTQVNLGKELYFAGTMSGNYFATTEDATAAPDVFIEEAEGGYRFYFMDGEVKTYIDIQEYQAGKSGVRLTAEPSATFVWNAELGVFTAYVAGADRYLGTYSTYNTISNSDIKYISGSNADKIGVSQFVARFIAYEAPDTPVCEHTNTAVEGKVDASCTTDGHTGKTVCADCGEVISEGEVIAATGHSFVDGICGACGEKDPNAPTNILIVGQPYKFGMTQGNLGYKVYYLNGDMDGYYLGTTTDFDTSVSVYVEEAEGGYYLYTLAGGAKRYINMVVSGTYVNGKYEETASTVYTYNAEKNTLIATINDTEYWFGTRNDKTYTTMGPVKVSYNGFFGQLYKSTGCQHNDTKLQGATDKTCTTHGFTGDVVCLGCGKIIKEGSWIPALGHSFVNGVCSECGEADPNYTPEPVCQHTNTTVEGKVDASCTTDGHTGKTVCADCGEVISEGEVIAAPGHSFADGTCGTCGEADPNYTPDEPEAPAGGLTEGVAYTISADNANGTLWFNGTVSSGRFNGSYDQEEAVSVYAEYVTGGFLLYFMDEAGKQYICIEDKSAGGSFSTDAASATVFEWNADKLTAAVADDSNNRGFGCGATSTYSNFSAYDLSGDYNWGQFIAVDGGSAEPEQPEVPEAPLIVGSWKQFSVVTEAEMLAIFFREDGTAAVSAGIYMTVQSWVYGENVGEITEEQLQAAIEECKANDREILEYNGGYYVSAGFGVGREATYVVEGNTVILTAHDYEENATGTLTLELVSDNQLKVVAVEGKIVDSTVTEHILVESIYTKK